MPISNPSELRKFLTELGVSPKKSLSQNFLIDGNILRKILKAAEVAPGDLVFEIGPGPGALTEALVEAGAEVIAVEKDHVFAEALKRFPVTVYDADVLEFPIEETFAGRKAKVIANLPYHITAPILGRLVPLTGTFTSITVMVQEEVARRMVAKPGTGDYSAFTVFLQFYTDVSYAFAVKRSCFYPAPTVDSAIVHLKTKKPPAVDAEPFLAFIHTAFQQRRKMLRASLKSLFSSTEVVSALEHLNLDPLSRPEMLSLEDFLALYAVLIK